MYDWLWLCETFDSRVTTSGRGAAAILSAEVTVRDVRALVSSFLTFVVYSSDTSVGLDGFLWIVNFGHIELGSSTFNTVSRRTIEWIHIRIWYPPP